MNKLSLGGLTLLLLHNALAAFGDVFVADATQRFHPAFLAGCAFSVGALVFGVFGLTQPRIMKDDLKRAPAQVLALNATTAASWLSMFLALQRIEPAIVSTIIVSFGPLFTIVIDNWLIARRPTSRTELLVAILIIGLIAGLARTSLAGLSAVSTSPQSVAIGLALAFVAAVGFSLAVVQISFLYKRLQWNKRTVLAVRFPLAIIASFALAEFPRAAMQGGAELLMTTLIAALSSILLPILVLNRALELISAKTAGLVLATLPAFTLLFQSFFERFTFSPLSFGLSVALVAVNIWALWHVQTLDRPLEQP